MDTPSASCAHEWGSTSVDGSASWCPICHGDVHHRETTGESAAATGALDRLDVRIVADHVQRTEADQWRLVAADLAAHASRRAIRRARENHDARVGRTDHVSVPRSDTDDSAPLVIDLTGDLDVSQDVLGSR